MRLIILWHVGKLSSLKLQQHRTKNDEVIVDGHVRWCIVVGRCMRAM